jgi:dihydrofolate reductase
MSLKLTAVVAMTSERVIGRAGQLPWHLPEDLAFFKRTTTGHPIVMGRKTYESIGRPLPKRRNIVLTRDLDWSAAGIEIAHNITDLVALPGLDGEVFIIGGAEIYSALMPHLDEILVSHVFEPHAGDTWFPAFEKDFSPGELIESHHLFEVRRYFKGRER